jgi:DNA excision repair protein ERCC-2
MPKKILTAPEIARIAKKRNLCPYELAKKLAKAVDVIALSYLYVFDPSIRETFIPELEIPMSRVVLVQDEAHNVPSTALDSASDRLTIGIIRQAMREGRTYNDEVTNDFCRALAQSIIEISAGLSSNDEMIVNPVGIYERALQEAGTEDTVHPLVHMNELGTSIRKNQLRHGKPPKSSIYRVADFMDNWLDYADRNDYAFVLSSELRRGQSRRMALERVALDPTAVTSPLLRLIRCSVAVSGTLSPLSAYAEMLGFEETSVKVSFRSPFSDQTRTGFVVEGLDTSYNARSEDMFARMVEHCAAVVGATPGNTGIFTTSYGIAAALQRAGLERKLSKKLYLEEKGAAGKKNDKMIEEFKSQGKDSGAVLLGVQGGRNSEGGDFPGPTMESVVVVGVPYGRPTPRTDALISYYDVRFNRRGRDYAYVLPAMTRAIQTAGRPVRRLDDRGVIVLLDQRFNTPYLKRFMPPWLGEIVRSIPDSPEILSSAVSDFFNGAELE